MTETQALQEIANAIKLLASSIGSISFALWCMLIFKNMGSSYTGCNKSILEDISKSLKEIAKKRTNYDLR